MCPKVLYIYIYTVVRLCIGKHVKECDKYDFLLFAVYLELYLEQEKMFCTMTQMVHDSTLSSIHKKTIQRKL